MPVGKAVIGQSGGPTAVINKSLVGFIKEAINQEYDEILGARHGLEGILKEDFVDLSKLSESQLYGISKTPAAALGSVRKKPTENDIEKLVSIFEKQNIRYFFYIGGNDSAETANLVYEGAKKIGYEIKAFHVPKTIDNDLLETDHCPGYGSAARFVAHAFQGDDADNRSLKGIKINVLMGRHAGWLTAASTLGKSTEEDGPHLVYVPEKVFNLDEFLKDVKELFDQADDKYAVMCVQHDYTPKPGIKMDGQKQTQYPRKNLSSVVLWNCGHPSNQKITVDMVNNPNYDGKFFHRFSWLDDSEIGSLPVDWNFLVGR